MESIMNHSTGRAFRRYFGHELGTVQDSLAYNVFMIHMQ